MGHETDVATAAENLHNTYAQLSVERQRRFWVRFFLIIHEPEIDFFYRVP